MKTLYTILISLLSLSGMAEVNNKYICAPSDSLRYKLYKDSLNRLVFLKDSAGSFRVKSTKNGFKIQKDFASETFKVAIRKSFDGAKEEQKAASILWNEDYKSDQHYFVIDAGIKIYEFDLTPKKWQRTQIFMSPVVEWHKDNIPDADKKKNNLSGGLNAELVHRAQSGHWYESPSATLSFSYKDDLIKKLNTLQSKLYLTFSGRRNGSPGASHRVNDLLFFRYYPYLGFEQYNDLSSKYLASYLIQRIYFDMYPVRDAANTFIQISFDYTHRVKTSDNLFNKQNQHWLSVALNFFPTGDEKFGIGVDYNRGADPNSNFVPTDRLSLGVKFKL